LGAREIERKQYLILLENAAKVKTEAIKWKV